MHPWFARNYELCFWGMILLGIATILAVGIVFNGWYALAAAIILRMPGVWFSEWLDDNRRKEWLKEK